MTIKEMINSRQLRRARISTEVLSKILTTGEIFHHYGYETIVKSGLPKGCCIVKAEFNEEYRTVDVTFWHEGFSDFECEETDIIEIEMKRERKP